MKRDLTQKLSLIKIILSLCLVTTLVGCSNRVNYAPVTEAWQQAKNAQGTHVVQVKDTLYSIAWRYGLDYRVLAKINHISPPYALRVGQSLNLVGSEALSSKMMNENTAVESATTQGVAAKPHFNATQSVASNKTSPNNASVTVQQKVNPSNIQAAKKGEIIWNWPVTGRIVTRFSATDGVNKGIDIAGKMGTPIKVAAPGRVVYAGNGLHGYGELIIVKHNDEFLSAYAHNRKILVKEGQFLKAGQVIAQMGNSESRQVLLHFEIRRAGVPVNPLSYIE